ncbi:hypothetical protein ABIC83_002467 [Roseateles asaccharophilus]|uniref:hypothetical protein n=1 Tax=Roseateles asaccharophilus TaxID=582607 RepID=UPI0038344A5F
MESSSHTQPPQVWPVIHLDTVELALANADIAARNGCAGVFVIDMSGRDVLTDEAAIQIKRRHPNLQVGVNYLSQRAPDALRRSIALGLDATWTDKPGVTSSGVNENLLAGVADLLAQDPDHLYFGSVAFKYQPTDADPPAAAARALSLGMIPTTSGLATGQPPEASKLFAMRQAVGSGPLAVASGIDPYNAYELGRFLTHILVATGISSSDTEFDEAALQRLMQQLEP